MGRCNASFWNLPDERLAAVLNTDPDRTVAVFAANSTLGTQVNSMLDTLALPMYSARVPLVPGRQLALDSSGDSVIPLPPPPTLPPALLAFALAPASPQQAVPACLRPQRPCKVTEAHVKVVPIHASVGSIQPSVIITPP